MIKNLIIATLSLTLLVFLLNVSTAQRHCSDFKVQGELTRFSDKEVTIYGKVCREGGKWVIQ